MPHLSVPNIFLHNQQRFVPGLAPCAIGNARISFTEKICLVERGHIEYYHVVHSESGNCLLIKIERSDHGEGKEHQERDQEEACQDPEGKKKREENQVAIVFSQLKLVRHNVSSRRDNHA